MTPYGRLSHRFKKQGYPLSSICTESLIGCFVGILTQDQAILLIKEVLIRINNFPKEHIDDERNRLMEILEYVNLGSQTYDPNVKIGVICYENRTAFNETVQRIPEQYCRCVATIPAGELIRDPAPQLDSPRPDSEPTFGNIYQDWYIIAFEDPK